MRQTQCVCETIHMLVKRVRGHSENGWSEWRWVIASQRWWSLDKICLQDVCMFAGLQFMTMIAGKSAPIRFDAHARIRWFTRWFPPFPLSPFCIHIELASPGATALPGVSPENSALSDSHIESPFSRYPICQPYRETYSVCKTQHETESMLWSYSRVGKMFCRAYCVGSNRMCNSQRAK